MWVARDKDGTLTLYKGKPVRGNLDKERWVTFGSLYECFEVDGSLFSNLKWEDDPIEVDICEHGLQEKYKQLKNEYEAAIEMAEWKDQQFISMLPDIFDFFVNNIGLYDGGWSNEDADKPWFIEEFTIDVLPPLK